MPIDLGSIQNDVGHITKDGDAYIVNIRQSVTQMTHAGDEGERMGDLFKDYGSGKPGLIEYIDQERAGARSHSGSQAAPSVIINMPQVDYLADGAIGKLIGLQRDLKTRGITDITIVNDDKSIKEKFTMTKLDRYFHFEPTLDDALVKPTAIVSSRQP